MVYAQGLWGVLANIIYTNWQVIDRFPEVHDIFYGLDFGFNDPNALLKLGQQDQRIYEQELLYQGGLTNPQLIDRMERLIPDKRKPIYADSAEPKTILEIARAGFNIHPCIKGKNSVYDGILFVKTKDIYVTEDSLNLIKEKQSYKWREDKDGNVLDEPVGLNDHCMSAERYAIDAHLGRGVIKQDQIKTVGGF